MKLKIVVAAFLIIGCQFLSQAQKTSNGETSSKQPMENSVVDVAMDLIRQRKFTDAREMLTLAAQKGEAEPQALLGQMYNAGWGVAINYDEAQKWWSLAVENGSADAMWGLGLLYDEGRGVPSDSKRAVELWKRACDLGNIKATVNLAYAYENGRGVQVDNKESTRLFGVAAKRNDPFAQIKYGMKCIDGEGVERDKALGCAWLAVASESEIMARSSLAVKCAATKASEWSALSQSERERAESLILQIQEKLKNSADGSKK